MTWKGFTWLKEIEKLFRVMACIVKQKVLFGTHMMYEEAEDWWDNACQRLEVNRIEVALVVFRVQFLEKYFLEDVHSKKEIEFLELKQGNSAVVEYATKFEELVKLCLHYNSVTIEGSKFIKFERGLRPDIKQVIGYQEICRFSVLVNKCTLYDEDSRVRSTHYKSISEKKVRDNFKESRM